MKKISLLVLLTVHCRLFTVNCFSQVYINDDFSTGLQGWTFASPNCNAGAYTAGTDGSTGSPAPSARITKTSGCNSCTGCGGCNVPGCSMPGDPYCQCQTPGSASCWTYLSKTVTFFPAAITFTFSFNWRSAANWSASSVNNAGLTIINNDNASTLASVSLISGGITDSGWQTYTGTFTVCGGVNSITIYFSTGDAWTQTPWCKTIWMDNPYLNVTNTVPLSSSISFSTSVSCFGGNNGTATVSATGGSPAYIYSWSPSGGNSSAATGLSAGNYTVIVTDAVGCTATVTVSITQPATALTASVSSSTNVSCNGGSNGSATVTAGGGTPAYTYAWSPSGGNLFAATGLSAGNYTVTVTDANGCTQTATVSITQPNALSVSINSTQTGCTVNNGTATANPSGGTLPYTYNWNNGQTAQTATGLSAGNYSVVITDSQGCTSSTTIAVTTINGPTAAVSAGNNVSCNGGNDGTATVSVSGGSPAYTYSWNPSGGTSSAATGLSAGNYTVTVTDANGCTDTATVAITQPSVLSVTISSTNVLCNTTNTGTAAASASGGTSPYTYQWSNSATTSAISNLTAQIYSVTITDTNGCTQSTTVQVNQDASPNAAISGNTSLCIGETATLTASGGTAYSWSTGATASSIIVSAAGTYSVAASMNGCSDTASVTVVVNFLPAVGIIPPVDTIQLGDNATLTASGGITYSWSNGSTTSIIVVSPTETTTYTVVVADTNGCTALDTVTVFVELNCGEVFVPNAFSPNGDGKNDVLFVRGKCIKALEFVIYNRWGQEVFRTTDLTKGWDGIYKDKKENTSVFVYYMEATLITGEKRDEKGTIILIR